MSQKFTTYSFNNTMLIWMQQLQRELEPSSQVAGYKSWQTKFKRQDSKEFMCSAFSFEMTGTAKGLTRFATAFTFSNSDSVEIHQNKTKIQLKDRTGITIDYSQPSAINTPLKVIISRAGQTESKLTFGDLN